ncbi:MAG: hypothetical protein HY040_28170 [Planctomycetes bacterium]|nr:hypothetical protein [Planctomycetota bacterium]
MDGRLFAKVPVWQRVALVMGAVAFIGFSLGCMCLNFGSSAKTEGVASDDGAFTQNGQINVPNRQEFVVYYPVPYASPPNLVVEPNVIAGCTVVDQKADHFVVRSDRTFPCELKWTARGVRTPSAASLTSTSGVERANATVTLDPVITPKQ